MDMENDNSEIIVFKKLTFSLLKMKKMNIINLPAALQK